MNSLQELLGSLMTFLNNVIIPFLFGLALLFFIWNAFRWLILGGAEKDAKDNAKRLALYGIGAFVFLVSLWGIVNMFVNGLGLGGVDQVEPDYMSNMPGGYGSGGGGGNNQYTEPFRGPR